MKESSLSNLNKTLTDEERTEREELTKKWLPLILSGQYSVPEVVELTNLNQDFWYKKRRQALKQHKKATIQEIKKLGAPTPSIPNLAESTPIPTFINPLETAKQAAMVTTCEIVENHSKELTDQYRQYGTRTVRQISKTTQTLLGKAHVMAEQVEDPKELQALTTSLYKLTELFTKLYGLPFINKEDTKNINLTLKSTPD